MLTAPPRCMDPDCSPVAQELRPRDQCADASYNPPRIVDGELVFDVFALGTRGAGKTVFLSALYYQLAVQDNKTNNFFVELQSETQKKHLINTYDALADPDTVWPPGSAVINEYEFRCFYFSGGDSIPLFRFKYLDYPGGFLTEDMDGAESFDVQKATQKAHSILVLIDGQKILQSLSGLTGRGRSLNADLNTLIPFLQKCAHRPIHFVITKWDILQDKYSFKQVKDELLNNENFRKFISQRVDLHSPVHLIPTSSLGKDFAVFDLKDLRMKKVKGGKIKPYNVELSIGMTITDQLLLLSNHPGYRDFRPQLVWLMKIVGFVVQSVRVTVELFALPSIIRVDKVVELMNSASDTLKANAEELQRKIEETVRTITNQRTAIEAVMMIQAMRRTAFENQFPESNLGSPEGT